MNEFETPIQFHHTKQITGIEVVYSKLTEISQGGPEIGMIAINGTAIPNYLFGGPWILNGPYLYIPVHVKKFLGSGFKLAKINVNDRSIEVIGKIKDLIFLNKIADNKLYFFEDLDQGMYRYYDI